MMILASKKVDDDIILANCDAFAIFQFMVNPEAKFQTHSLTKTKKISNTALILCFE